MNMTDITIAYGQTESSPVITQTTVTDTIERRVETVGKVHPHVEMKIVDPDTGETLGPDEQGELCTRGYLVMKGYYKMDEATKRPSMKTAGSIPEIWQKWTGTDT